SPVQYAWTCSDGSLTKEQTAQPNWQAPATPGIYSVTLSASNAMGTATFTSPVLVKSFDNTDEPVPIIYYPLNGDTYNKAQDAFHAISVNGVSATGANGLPNGALDFPSTNAYLYTPNELALNFRDHLSLSFWIKPDALPTYEQFILSHGSWEERYKVSITPEKKVRWTVKTDQAVVDVDDDTTLNIGSFYQYTAMYTGYSLELYRNGLLSGFKSLTGLMGTTSKSLTVSRKDASTSDYHFEGTVDEIRLYTTELPQYVIQALPSTFTLKRTSDSVNAFRVAPNPFTDQIQLQLPSDEAIHNTILFNAYGRKVYQTDLATRTLTVHVPDGIYFIQINTDAGNVYHAKLLRQD
ncbi:MAG: LamG-like jellyroll fold domain-containing protein, partial [Bacteroidota bacterium]|nr:LamG-like jellyroll fold domain-containing protein [Bacteroidota bacterium]